MPFRTMGGDSENSLDRVLSYNQQLSGLLEWFDECCCEDKLHSRLVFPKSLTSFDTAAQILQNKEYATEPGLKPPAVADVA